MKSTKSPVQSLEVQIEVPFGWDESKDLAYYHQNAEWEEEFGCLEDSFDAIETEAYYLDLVLDAAIRYYAHKLGQTLKAPQSSQRKIGLIKNLLKEYSNDTGYRERITALLSESEKVAKLRCKIWRRINRGDKVWLIELVQVFDLISDAYYFLTIGLCNVNPDFKTVMRP